MLIKNLLLTTSFLYFSLIALSQPLNDDCTAAIELIPDSSISLMPYTFNGATRDLSVGLVSPTLEDVFFKFTATDYMHNIIVNASNSADWMSVGLIVLEGDCGTGFTALSGINMPETYSSSEGVCRYDGFTPGTEYFILLSNVSGSNLGDFEIMITRTTVQGEWCFDSELITSGNSYSGSNFFSTQDGEDFEISPDDVCAITLENGYWYKYIAESSGLHEFVFDNMMYYGGEGSNVGLGHQIGILESIGGDCMATTSIACDSSEFYYANLTVMLNQGDVYYIIVEGDAGGLVSYDIEVIPSDLLVDENQATDFEVFPTFPDNSITLRVSTGHSYTVNISSANGQTVWKSNSFNQSELEIDVADWNKGMYFVQVRNENETKTLRFIK